MNNCYLNRFETTAVNEREPKDVHLTDQDKTKYIEEHEFHVEQDDTDSITNHHQKKAIVYIY